MIGDAQHEVSASAPEYRALVCVVLGGGADSFNMLVPTDTLSYRHYAERRANLALNRDGLLSLSAGDRDGRSYGLHQGMRGVRALYARGEVAILANAGVMQDPVRRGRANSALELSHSDFIARWHHGTADRRSSSGWAGRVADVLADHVSNDQLPMNISMSGRNVMQLGARTVAANLQSGLHPPHSGLPVGVDFSYVNEQLAEQAVSAARPWSVRRRARQIESVEANSKLIVEDAIADGPLFKSPFGTDSFSSDMERVARIIAARRKHEVRQQIFFVHFDGWDGHHRLLETQAILLPMLSRGLAAFRDALIEHDALDDVTTFTVSEFGRALEPSNSGSDHGWGGHHIVMGGAVRGGRVHGRYPSLAAGNTLDIGGGSFMPTTSMDEYLAEMVLWLGVPVSELPYVLPDISKFWSPNSGTPPIGLLT